MLIMKDFIIKLYFYVLSLHVILSFFITKCKIFYFSHITKKKRGFFIISFVRDNIQNVRVLFFPALFCYLYQI
jgi:hypothetical protein